MKACVLFLLLIFTSVVQCQSSFDTVPLLRSSPALIKNSFQLTCLGHSQSISAVDHHVYLIPHSGQRLIVQNKAEEQLSIMLWDSTELLGDKSGQFSEVTPLSGRPQFIATELYDFEITHIRLQNDCPSIEIKMMSGLQGTITTSTYQTRITLNGDFFLLHQVEIEEAEAKEKSLALEEIYRLSDTFYLGHQKYVISDILPEQLILKNYGITNKRYGSREGFFTYPLTWILESDSVALLDKVHDLPEAYTLLHFWGPWCDPCLDELPLINNLYDKLGHNINFIGLSVDFKSKEADLEYTLLKYHVEWPNYSLTFDGDSDLLNRFGILSYPTTILLDGDGQIIIRIDGTLKNNDKLMQWLKAAF